MPPTIKPRMMMAQPHPECPLPANRAATCSGALTGLFWHLVQGFLGSSSPQYMHLKSSCRVGFSFGWAVGAGIGCPQWGHAVALVET
jgi:hypothetical protein